MPVLHLPQLARARPGALAEGAGHEQARRQAVVGDRLVDVGGGRRGLSRRAAHAMLEWRSTVGAGSRPRSACRVPPVTLVTRAELARAGREPLLACRAAHVDAGCSPRQRSSGVPDRGRRELGAADLVSSAVAGDLERRSSRSWPRRSRVRSSPADDLVAADRRAGRVRARIGALARRHGRPAGAGLPAIDGSGAGSAGGRGRGDELLRAGGKRPAERSPSVRRSSPTGTERAPGEALACVDGGLASAPRDRRSVVRSDVGVRLAVLRRRLRDRRVAGASPSRESDVSHARARPAAGVAPPRSARREQVAQGRLGPRPVQAVADVPPTPTRSVESAIAARRRLSAPLADARPLKERAGLAARPVISRTPTVLW